ncbi:putative high mobility group [Lyophyllum shimeji]|uniref:High mobility group n=1 Tax=Lyophyllum shimeji TaxID=47721 RepID=A0A9P3URD7_LYOSH|nr:putative high mobility group [Lyophyllum shimeji]
MSFNDLPTLPSDPNHIPRPPNAWILYRSDEADKLPKTLTTLQKSTIVAQKWRTEAVAVRQKYFDKAEELLQKHLIQYPGYKYRPVRRAEKEKIKQEKKQRSLAAKGGVTKKRKAARQTPLRTVPPAILPPLTASATLAGTSSSPSAMSSSSWLGDNANAFLLQLLSHPFLPTPSPGCAPDAQAPLHAQHSYAQPFDARRYSVAATCASRAEEQCVIPRHGGESGQANATEQNYVTFNSPSSTFQNALDWNPGFFLANQAGSAFMPLHDPNQQHDLREPVTADVEIGLGHMGSGDSFSTLNGCWGDPPSMAGPSTSTEGTRVSGALSGDPGRYEGYSFDDFINFDPTLGC